MFVNFELSPDQLARALDMVARVAAQVDELGAEVSCSGNLHYIFNECVVNPHQYLDVDASSSTLVYEGERCPLGQDGGLEALREIAGAEGLSALKVLEYRTTMPEMAWWETRADLALRQIAACNTLAEAARVVDSRVNVYSKTWQLRAAYAALDKFPGAAYAAPGTMEYRRLVASGEVENAKLRSQLQAMWD